MTTILSLLFSTLLLTLTTADIPEPTIYKHHPINTLLPTPPTPPLLRQWHHTTDDPDHGLNAISVGFHLYKPRSSAYEPYKNWDLLVTEWKNNDREDYLTLEMNRAGEMVLILEEGYGGDLEGWEVVEGVEGVLDGDGVVMVGTGRMKEHVREVELVKKGKVFRRGLKEGVNLIGDPRKGLAKKHVFLIGEVGGKGSEEPEFLEGKRIRVGGLCPEELHEIWGVVRGSKGDKDGDGEVFRGWHPQVDPIYWCYYGHEHGSDPRIMGYTHYMDYVARKNEEEESERGFKDYIFEKNDHWIFLSLHAHLSDKRRFDTRFHTTIFAVADKKGDLKAELSCKGDFGPAVARGTGSDHERLPLTEKDKEMMDELWDNKDYLRERLFNVQSPGYKPSSLEYDPQNLSHYENWVNGVAELCTSAPDKLNHDRLDDDKMPRFIIDIRDPNTARARMGEDGDEISYMSDYPGEFSAGFTRMILQQGAFSVGEKYCKFEDGEKLSDYASSKGVFYTDPYCKKLLKGPGPNAVRQYIEPGFLLNIPITNPRGEYRDSYDTKNPWTNEYEVTPQNVANTRERFFQPQLNLAGMIDYRQN